MAEPAMHTPSLRLQWQRRATLVRLRVALSAADAARQRLDLAAPLEARRAGDCLSLWLGPDQWLLRQEHAPADALCARIGARLAGLRHHAVDVSAAMQCVQLGGNAARTLLAMGSGIDCSPRGMRPGSCVRTRFARLAVVMHCTGEQAFDLYFDHSFRAYLDEWLRRAADDPLIARAAN